MAFSDFVGVVEVGPMDGFQRESTFIPAGVKIGQMEVTSFTLQAWRQRIWKEVRRR
jgi:hypothetical protein